MSEIYTPGNQPETNTGTEAAKKKGAGFLSNTRISGRIGLLTGLAIVGLLGVGGAFLFGDVQIVAKQERANEFAKLELISTQVARDALQMRRREKDFILRADLKYAEKYDAAANSLLAGVDKIEKLSIGGTIGEVTARIRSGIGTHVDTLHHLVDLQRKLGFDEKEGLQGSLRAAVHEVELKLATLGLDGLTVKMLMMRRHEKDFILRGDDKYIESIAKRREELLPLLAAAAIADADKQQLRQLLDKYVADFNAYTQAYKEGKVTRKQLSAVYAEVEPSLEALFKVGREGNTAAQAELKSLRSSIRVIVVAIGVAILVTFSVFAVWLARGMTGPINTMTGAMKSLAGGDKTVNIPATSRKDEIGDMARSVLVFKENMIEAERLTDEQAIERQAKEQRAEAVVHLTGNFDRVMAESLGSVASAATELQQTAASMATTAEQTSQQASSVSTASNQATVNVQAVATSAEELSMSISEISRQVGQSAKIAGDAVERARATNETVRGLDVAATRIGEVVTLINDIAGRTNLLALNATIEAARAGEAGKGFAVVAQEVKDLANQTAKATGEISTQIASVQEETRGTVSAIDDIVGVIGEINDIATTIASAVEQQGVSTQEIAINVQQVAQGTQEVNANIAGVTDAAASSGEASSQVLTSSQELSHQAESLRIEVEKFLEGVRAA